MNLSYQINNLKKQIGSKVNSRLKEFSSFKSKSNDAWFSELCFCILTANSKARTALQIQKELGEKGFLNYSQKKITEIIRRNKHRFHNNKARFIVLAREHKDIKNIIISIVNEKGQQEAREWLVKNIKGLGYKEASHFLRNVGYFNLAILDRHIINLMLENKILKEKPKSLNRKTYLEIEKKFISLSNKLKMKPAELDLYMWYMKAGEVLK